MLTDILKSKLKSTINECDKHLDWMLKAKNNIRNLFPLTPEAYHQLKDTEVPLIDQFVYRFTKLQDTMGLRLFSLLLNVLAESTKTMSFIDILNRLEQLNYLDSKDTWLSLRNLRNRAAHEYDDCENAEVLNLIYNNSDILVNIYTNIRSQIVNQY